MTMLPEERVRLEALETKISDLQNKFEKLGKLENKVDKLMDIIVGDLLIDEDLGLVGKLKALDLKLTNLEKLWDKIKFFAMGGLFFSGYGIYQLLKNFVLSGIFK